LNGDGVIGYFDGFFHLVVPGDIVDQAGTACAAECSLTDVMAVLLSAPDAETLWACLRAYFLREGFDRLKYGYAPEMSGVDLGENRDFLMLSSMPREFSVEFIDKGFVRHNYLIRWGAEHVGVVSFSLVHDRAKRGELSNEELANMSLHRRFDVSAGFSVSFPPALARGRGGLSVIARPGMSQDEVDARLHQKSGEYYVVATAAHQRLIALPHAHNKRKLTPRQREVLEWLAGGHSVNDTALVMGLSVATIEKHLRLAREALGAESTTHAIAKAAYGNQIFWPNRTEPRHLAVR
jgi:LuxR family transcriptional regulator